MASRYCLNESNRFVEVDASDGNLEVTIFQQGEERKKAVLTPERWAQLVHISEEVNEAVNKLMKNQLTTALQIHLGGKWHVSVTPGYRCVDIRHFYWNRRGEEAGPNKNGDCSSSAGMDIIPGNDVAYSFAASGAVVSATLLGSTRPQRTGMIIFIIIIIIINTDVS
jgi:hypothetical protein